jgi:CRISPR system Cascade subunit CasC
MKINKSTKVNKSTKLEFHVIQTSAFSAGNCDDLGRPKTGKFGGTERVKPSSQSYSRTIKDLIMTELADNETVDKNSRRHMQSVSDILIAEYGFSEEEAIASVSEFFKKLFPPKKESRKNKKSDEKEDTEDNQVDEDTKEKLLTPVLYMLSAKHHKLMAKLIADLSKDDKSSISIAKQVSIMKQEIASGAGIMSSLFGRMFASAASLNVEATLQRADMFSTHKAEEVYDSFTAVDDILQEDSTGAAHLGHKSIFSSCLYKNVNWDFAEWMDKNHIGAIVSGMPEDEAKNLLKKLVRLFVKSIILSMPMGKKSSKFSHNLPSLVLINVIEAGEVTSLANAFEEPIKSNKDGGYLQNSITAMMEQHDRDKKSGFKIYKGSYLYSNCQYAVKKEDGTEQFTNINDLLDKLVASIL